MIIKTESIDWDTGAGDGDDDMDVWHSLPQRVTLEVEDYEDIADALSDSFGWCVFGYTLSEASE